MSAKAPMPDPHRADQNPTSTPLPPFLQAREEGCGADCNWVEYLIGTDGVLRPYVRLCCHHRILKAVQK